MDRLARAQRSFQSVTLYDSLANALAASPVGLLSYGAYGGGTIFLQPNSNVTALAFYGQAAEPPSVDALGPILVDLIVNPGYYAGISVGSTGLAIPIPDECFGLGGLVIVPTLASGHSEVCNLGFKG